MACKCPPTEKTDCNEAGNKANDHCKNYCEFKTYRQDSDRLHSILVALTNNRMPIEVVQHVGMTVRERKNINKRSIDVKRYVELLNGFVNHLKISCTSIIVNPQNERSAYQQNKRNQNNSPNSQTPYSPQGGQHKHQKEEVGLVGNARRVKKPPQAERKTPWCLLCQNEHWLDKFPDAKRQDIPAIMRAIREVKACTVCFKRGHSAKDCRSKESTICYYCRDNNLVPEAGHRLLVCP